MQGSQPYTRPGRGPEGLQKRPGPAMGNPSAELSNTRHTKTRLSPEEEMRRMTPPHASSSGSSAPSASASASAPPPSPVPWSEWALMAGRLWWAGFADACSPSRCVLFFVRSHVIVVKTVQCFALNGCIFLGSVFFLHFIMSPSLRWLLSVSNGGEGGGHGNLLDSSSSGSSHGPASSQSLLVSLYKACWLYPLYLTTFIISNIWYKDIAKHAFKALEAGTSSSTKFGGPASGPYSASESGSLSRGGAGRRSGIGGSGKPGTGSGAPKAGPGQGMTPVEKMLKGVGEQIYGVLLLTFFSAQIFLVGFIPVIGDAISFVLLTWLYAFYCFDYRWSFSGWDLSARLRFFEDKWAFFSGFGTPMVLLTFFLPTWVAAGVLAVLFPLFVLVATASDPDRAVIAAAGSDRAAARIGRLPVFRLASSQTLGLFKLFQPRD